MNALSWIIYFADVLPTFANLLAGLSFAALFPVLGFFIFYTVAMNEGIGEEERDRMSAARGRLITQAVPLILLAWIVSALIPSRSTIFMIAGSEIGESAITSPEAREVVNELRAILKKKAEELKN